MDFAYRAGAVAFGGRMTRPYLDAPLAQAATSLPPVGGYAAAFVQDYTYRYRDVDLVSFRAAASLALGSDTTETNVRTFVTQVSVTIEGLQVLQGLVTADKIVARLSSKHPAPPPVVELPMLPEGSSISNLRIDGQLINPKTHPQVVQENAAQKSAVDRFCAQLCNPRSGKAAQAGNPTLFSIFDDASLPKGKQGQVIYNPGCRIDIPDFGKIFLGESFVFADRRLLIMMRLQMGSPQEGELILGSVEGNGVPM